MVQVERAQVQQCLKIEKKKKNRSPCICGADCCSLSISERKNRKEKAAPERRIQECRGVHRSSGAGRSSSRLIPRAVGYVPP